MTALKLKSSYLYFASFNLALRTSGNLNIPETLPFLGGTRRGQNNWTLNPKPLEIEAKRPILLSRRKEIRIALFELFGIFFFSPLDGHEPEAQST